MELYNYIVLFTYILYVFLLLVDIPAYASVRHYFLSNPWRMSLVDRSYELTAHTLHIVLHGLHLFGMGVPCYWPSSTCLPSLPFRDYEDLVGASAVGRSDTLMSSTSSIDVDSLGVTSSEVDFIVGTPSPPNSVGSTMNLDVLHDFVPEAPSPPVISGMSVDADNMPSNAVDHVPGLANPSTPFPGPSHMGAILPAAVAASTALPSPNYSPVSSTGFGDFLNYLDPPFSSFEPTYAPTFSRLSDTMSFYEPTPSPPDEYYPRGPVPFFEWDETPSSDFFNPNESWV